MLGLEKHVKIWTRKIFTLQSVKDEKSGNENFKENFVDASMMANSKVL